jgi:hypothetical protein
LIKQVTGFQELVRTPFSGGVNALSWNRTLPGDFGEIVRAFDAREPITVLDEAMLRRLELRAEGPELIKFLLEDLRLLRELGRDPVLNLISGYPRDDSAGPVPTDVFSFHVDSAPVETDTWLCTYHGSPSEGLLNEDAIKKADEPNIRAALLKEFGGKDDEEFRVWLSDNCYDLHFAPKPGAQPYSFGVGHLWRIAIDHPGNRLPQTQVSGLRSQVSASPPCIHRAPETIAGQPRLLLIA